MIVNVILGFRWVLVYRILLVIVYEGVFYIIFGFTNYYNFCGAAVHFLFGLDCSYYS